MIDWILEILKESGAVGNNNETIVKYGLQKAGSFLLDLIITFICAAFFGIPIEGLVFWIVLFVQRMYIGGYHAKTQLRCLFISWIVTIISFWIIKMDMSDSCLLYTSAVLWNMMRNRWKWWNTPISRRFTNPRAASIRW